LRELYLINTGVNDLSRLSSYSNLTVLHLYGNQISDISPLSDLPNLEVLNLGYNNIDDISVLLHLTDLIRLDLSLNYIEDISPLSDLSDLALLSLGYNRKLVNISALSDLTNLNEIYLYATDVEDIKPLVDNRGLSSGDYVNLAYAPLSSTSRDEYIPELESRGVQVIYTTSLGWSIFVWGTMFLGIFLIVILAAWVISWMQGRKKSRPAKNG
jgi:Leucine-rich repeat (LRR) protein